MSNNLGQVSAVHLGTAPPGNTNLLWGQTDNNDPNTQQVYEWYKYFSGAWTSFRELYSAIHEDTAPPNDAAKIWKVIDGSDNFVEYRAYTQNGGTWDPLFDTLEANAVAEALLQVRDGASAGYQTLAEIEARIGELRMDQVATPTGRNIVATDAYKVLDCTNTGDITIGIVNDGTVDFAIGSIIIIERNGTGKVFVSAPAGVTLNGVDGDAYEITSQYDACSIRKRAANTWVIKGNIQ